MLRNASTINVTYSGGIPGYYGSFYSSVDQSDGVNTPNAMAVENTFTADGVSVVANGSGKKTRITFANTGTYNIQFSTVFHHTGGGGSGGNIDVWFALNGNAIANSNTRITTVSNNPYTIGAWNFIESLAAGDYIEIIWMTDNANVVLENLPAGASAPATPSVIITAQQIR